MAKIIADENIDIEEVMEKIGRIENKLKFQAFGKCSNKKKIPLAPKNIKTNQLTSAELLEMQTKRVDREIEKVKETSQGKINQIFKLAKLASGKGAMQAHAVNHPVTGKLIVNQEEIKKVSIEYCQKVLTKNEPDEHYKELSKLKEELHKKRMCEDLDCGFKAEREVFECVLDKFKKNGKRSYDFLIKASVAYKETIFNLCKRIIEKETIPQVFRNTTLHQIWKRKPGTKKEDLKANRYIHCKEWLPRTVEAIVVKEMDQHIQKATSIFQIGGKAGHRPQEHLFCVKSIIARNVIMKKKLIILVCYDITGFFDKEVLVDAMDELHCIGVDPRAYRLFYGLNESTRVRVRTGCGYSDWGEVGELLGQGSGGAAKVSALNLSRKLDNGFEGSEELAKYGSVKQQPYSFQDDVLIPVDNIEGLLAVNVKMTSVMNSMQTKLNQTKSGYILMGPKKLVEEARWRLTLSPAMCGDVCMKELGQEKWLGDMFAGGLKESVMATITSRQGKVRRAALEIMNTVQDYRAQRVGGFLTGLLLWESCCIPSSSTTAPRGWGWEGRRKRS